MSAMQALKVQPPAKASLQNVPVPSPREGYLLVRVFAVALNPTDWKHIGFVSNPVTVGCDYAGTVAAVGPGCTKAWSVGDRVCGVVHGSNESRLDEGSFAEYVLAKADLQIRIPDSMSYEAAAGLGMGVSTVGQGMYQALGLPWPNKPDTEKTMVLIYGGSTAMGAYGIQYGVASGLRVITTCSPRNNEYVKSLGAEKSFDYNAPDCGAQIRKYTENKLVYAWDAIGEGESPRICGEALAEPAPAGKKLKYANVLRGKVPRDDVESTSMLMYTTFGEEFVKLGRTMPALPDHFEFMIKFVDMSEKLIADGTIKPHTYEVREGGLAGIMGGLDDMRNGKVSAKKLVYTISKKVAKV